MMHYYYVQSPTSAPDRVFLGPSRYLVASGLGREEAERIANDVDGRVYPRQRLSIGECPGHDFCVPGTTAHITHCRHCEGKRWSGGGRTFIYTGRATWHMSAWDGTDLFEWDHSAEEWRWMKAARRRYESSARAQARIPWGANYLP